jgi:hypothetical protein
MKYNPRACNTLAMLPQFLSRHPLADADTGQGFLASMHELQEMLKEVTGMAAVSMAPMAGAHGEFAGVAMIRAYHDARGDTARREIIVPDAAHGTNPATATHVRLHGQGDSHRPPGQRRPGRPEGRRRPPDRRPDADQPLHPGRVREDHRRHPEDRARGGRPCPITTAPT